MEQPTKWDPTSPSEGIQQSRSGFGRGYVNLFHPRPFGGGVRDGSRSLMTRSSSQQDLMSDRGFPREEQKLSHFSNVVKRPSTPSFEPGLPPMYPESTPIMERDYSTPGVRRPAFDSTKLLHSFRRTSSSPTPSLPSSATMVDQRHHLPPGRDRNAAAMSSNQSESGFSSTACNQSSYQQQIREVPVRIEAPPPTSSYSTTTGDHRPGRSGGMMKPPRSQAPLPNPPMHQRMTERQLDEAKAAMEAKFVERLKSTRQLKSFPYTAAELQKLEAAAIEDLNERWQRFLMIAPNVPSQAMKILESTTHDEGPARIERHRLSAPTPLQEDVGGQEEIEEQPADRFRPQTEKEMQHLSSPPPPTTAAVLPDLVPEKSSIAVKESRNSEEPSTLFVNLAIQFQDNNKQPKPVAASVRSRSVGVPRDSMDDSSAERSSRGASELSTNYATRDQESVMFRSLMASEQNRPDSFIYADRQQGPRTRSAVYESDRREKRTGEALHVPQVMVGRSTAGDLPQPPTHLVDSSKLLGDPIAGVRPDTFEKEPMIADQPSGQSQASPQINATPEFTLRRPTLGDLPPPPEMLIDESHLAPNKRSMESRQCDTPYHHEKPAADNYDDKVTSLAFDSHLPTRTPQVTLRRPTLGDLPPPPPKTMIDQTKLSPDNEQHIKDYFSSPKDSGDPLSGPTSQMPIHERPQNLQYFEKPQSPPAAVLLSGASRQQQEPEWRRKQQGEPTGGGTPTSPTQQIRFTATTQSTSPNRSETVVTRSKVNAGLDVLSSVSSAGTTSPPSSVTTVSPPPQIEGVGGSYADKKEEEPPRTSYVTRQYNHHRTSAATEKPSLDLSSSALPPTTNISQKDEIPPLLNSAPSDQIPPLSDQQQLLTAVNVPSSTSAVGGNAATPSPTPPPPPPPPPPIPPAATGSIGGSISPRLQTTATSPTPSGPAPPGGKADPALLKASIIDELKDTTKNRYVEPRKVRVLPPKIKQPSSTSGKSMIGDEQQKEGGVNEHRNPPLSADSRTSPILVDEQQQKQHNYSDNNNNANEDEDDEDENVPTILKNTRKLRKETAPVIAELEKAFLEIRGFHAGGGGGGGDEGSDSGGETGGVVESRTVPANRIRRPLAPELRAKLETAKTGIGQMKPATVRDPNEPSYPEAFRNSTGGGPDKPGGPGKKAVGVRFDPNQNRTYLLSPTPSDSGGSSKGNGNGYGAQQQQQQPRRRHQVGGAHQTPKNVQTFDEEIINGALANFLHKSSVKSLAGLCQLSDLVEAAFVAQREFILQAQGTKKSDGESKIAEMVKPTADKISQIQELAGQNRQSNLFNNFAAVSEGIPALSWVLDTSTPSQTVKNFVDASMYYGNRVLKMTETGTNADQREWVKSWLGLLNGLREYVRCHHMSGLVWNTNPPLNQSIMAGSSSPSSLQQAMSDPPMAPPPPPTTTTASSSSAGGPPPIPPLSIPYAPGASSSSSKRKQPGVVEPVKSNLKSSNQGNSSKVTNPESHRRQQPSSTKTSHSGGRIDFKGRKWSVENFFDEEDVKISVRNMSEVVHIWKCDNCVIDVCGKGNSITVDNCHNTIVSFDSLVSEMNVINSRQIQLMSKGTMPTLSIQKTDGCLVYLSLDSADAEIVSGRSTQMFAQVPTKGGGYKEYSIPEGQKFTVSKLAA